MTNNDFARKDKTKINIKRKGFPLGSNTEKSAANIANCGGLKVKLTLRLYLYHTPTESLKSALRQFFNLEFHMAGWRSSTASCSCSYCTQSFLAAKNVQPSRSSSFFFNDTLFIPLIRRSRRALPKLSPKSHFAACAWTRKIHFWAFSSG